MNILEYMKNNIVCLDGGMGTILQSKGLLPGELPERWNISHPEIIREIHQSYFEAGSNVISTNTFGANALKFSDEELREIIEAAVQNAREAKNRANCESEKFIALDIGSCGKLLKPYGDFDFEEAVELFAKTVRVGASCGVDLIFIETMNDSYETKAALLAAKENCALPVFVSNAYGEDGKLMTGASPEAMAAMLEGMGADAIGANCSLGPKQLISVIRELLENASVPVILKPNAGLPRAENGKTVFDVSTNDFSSDVATLVSEGVRVVGGCCGTTPNYIKALCDKTRRKNPLPVAKKNLTVVSSFSHCVTLGIEPVLIGERINPTGKKRFKQALLENDIDYVLGEGVRQQECGVHILDVNVGMPDIDETEMLCRCICELQAVTDLPLQIDTSNTEALAAALRRYNGKAMINSVNGKAESMRAVFPLVKKYGGVVVALTLNENGIPPTAEGRVAVAEKILAEAQKYGIDKKDIIFDTLAMTVSADKDAATATLKALNVIKNKLGCHTSLGVSNISFGLPQRDAVNGVFFALALESGLSAAIMNPFSAEMMKTYYTYRLLKGMDENCSDYITASEKFSLGTPSVTATLNTATQPDGDGLRYAIIKGFKEKSAELTKQLLGDKQPLDIVNGEIIPALDTVGKRFEEKTLYLPQLLMSAEAAKFAFDAVKNSLQGSQNSENGAVFVIATVKGDIHDIGKNIVKLLLQNYGFRVVDLGKDVPPEKIVDTVTELHAPLAGLSALMTTTVPAMEETVSLLKKKAPWCKTVVGGAVLTAEYADKIGADKYAKDAMETVRYAEKVIKGE